MTLESRQDLPTPGVRGLTCVANDDQLEKMVLVGQGFVSDDLIGLSFETVWASYIGRFKHVATILASVSKSSYANWKENKDKIA